MSTVETHVASTPSAASLPPGPRIPKFLQGIAFGFFRRRIRASRGTALWGRVHAARADLRPDRGGGQPAACQADVYHQPGRARQHPAQPEPVTRSGFGVRARPRGAPAAPPDSWRRRSTARASRTTKRSSKRKRCARSPTGPRACRSPPCDRPCASRSTRSCARSSVPKAPSSTNSAESCRRGSRWVPAGPATETVAFLRPLFPVGPAGRMAGPL